MIDCVVAPVLQVFPLALLDVSVTLLPEQNDNGPPAEMVGVAGNGLTVTVLDPLAEVHPFPLVTFTVYVPDELTTIDCVVAPVLQVLPVALDEVNVTLPPVQNVVGPLAETVGVLGKGFTVIIVEALGEVQPPLT